MHLEFALANNQKDHRLEIAKREQRARLWLDAEPSVRAYVSAAVSDYHDVQDVVQEVAVSVARSFDKYDESRPFVAWAIWTAKLRIADYYRRTQRKQRVFSDALLEELGGAIAARHVEQSDRQAALESCVQKLPERSRQMIRLRYEEDASSDEVAKAIGSSPGSVRVMLYRVRNQLGDCVRTELEKGSACPRLAIPTGS